MQLEGKAALVTGAASGLGTASARMLAQAGVRVLMVDRSETPPLDGALFIAADVTNPHAMEAAVDTALSAFGALHILIHCAGIGHPMRVLGKDGAAMPLDSFARVVQVNLIGTYNTVRLCAAAMNRNTSANQEKGVIVLTASIAAFDGQIGQASYAASKGGVVGMTLPLARDLARHGIRVATIAPGIFDTPMLAGLSDEVRASLGAQVPYPPRLGRPEEYAQMARSIIENEMLNGEVIRLDGALRMAPR
ncbi:MAG: SDR family NAD(P)-dependent oxidoreductase [Bryobacterales bacterium]|nr:SDR family NAD(P)-dependent oxidoreductase [Bryobacterales bacterium]